MTIGGVLAAIAALGSIATAVVYILKIAVKSTAQKDADIDKEIAKERQEAEETGRPV